MTAEVRDLSASGARIVLPISGGILDVWDVASIGIQGIGQFDAEFRWASGNAIGVYFPRATDRIADFLATLNVAPLGERVTHRF